MARLQFKQVLQIDPDIVDAYYNLGLTEIRLGNIKQALGNFLRVTTLRPDHCNAHIQIGKIMLDASFPQKAVDRAVIVLAVDAHDPTALKLKATALLQQKKNQDKVNIAAQIFEELLKSGDTSAEIYHQSATALLYQNSLKEAQARVAEGLAQNPKDTSLYELLAKIYLQQNEKKKAIRTYRRLVTMVPKKPDYVFDLAGLLWQTDQKDDAQQVLAQRMLTVGAEDDSAWIRLAHFYDQKKEYDLSQNTLIAGLQTHPDSFELRLSLTRILVNQANYTEAIERLQPYLHKHQHRPGLQISDAQLLLSKSYLAIGELDTAEQYANTYLENHPQNQLVHSIKGTIHLLNNDPHSATAEFWSILQADPSNDLARIELAHAMTRTAQWQEAIEILNEGLNSNKDDLMLRHALFHIHVRLKNYHHAEKQLEKMLSNSAEKTQIMILLADFYQSINEFDKAEDSYKTILNKLPDDTTAHIGLSTLYIRHQKFNDAIDLLLSSTATLPASNDILTALIDTYLKTEKYTPALKTVRARLKTDPQNGHYHILMGRIYTAMREYGKAESAYKAAIKYESDSVAPHTGLMQFWHRQKRKDKIISHFRLAMKDLPDAIGPPVALAQFHILEGRHSTAIDIYETLISKHNELLEETIDLIQLLCDHPRNQADYTNALNIAKRMLRFAPENARVLDSLGWAYYHQGDLNRAQGYLYRSLSLAPNLISALYHLAKVSIDAGQLKTAEYALEKILSDDAASAEKNDARKILKNLPTKKRLQG